ncbi:MAG: YbgC/FadM family acyl-CoA thioesterase [Hyphomicrobiaceae bacterium]|nr:YbgC/FadM family acyl-CoA thioesterase [Hyphomicrobiaceae bacterium]
MMNQKPHDQKWPDLAGRIKDKQHILPIRVYFEDTDFSGLVYHGSYLRWCERGRSDWMRLLGVSHEELFAGVNGSPPLMFIVRNMEMKFKRPAKIDEILHVVSTTKDWSGASITMQQDIRRGDTLLMRAIVQVVLISDKGKPQRLPKHLAKTFGYI